MMQLNNCRICNNSENNKEYTAQEMMYGLRDEFVYFECSQCNCLQIKEFPSNMLPYYPDEYYSLGEYDGRKFKGFTGKIRKWKYGSLVSQNKILRKVARGITGKKDFDIFHGFEIKKATRILDVGCGSGQNFLYPLAEVGFENLMGCDPYLKKPITYANGLSIVNSEIHELQSEWDIITFHHAFEHMPDPLKNLQKVFSLLNANGTCIVRIPTVSSYAWRHYKTDWVQLDAPRHFFLHSIESMAYLAKISNLELFKVVYDSGEFQFRGSEKYKKDISLFAPEPKGLIKSAQRKIRKQRYKRLAKKLNENENGDQAAFYFRKKVS